MPEISSGVVRITQIALISFSTTDVGQTTTEANVLAVIDHNMAEIMQHVLADPAQPATVLASLPGHDVIMGASELNAGQKENLADAQTAFKVSLKGINNASCKVAAILYRILYWASNSHHRLPDTMSARAGMTEKWVEVGVLNVDHPSKDEIRNALQARGIKGVGVIMRSRTTKHLVAQYGVQTADANRKTGAHVWIRAKLGSNRVASRVISERLLYTYNLSQAEIEFVDAKGNILGPAPAMSWINGITETNACYQAFGSTIYTKQFDC